MRQLATTLTVILAAALHALTTPGWDGLALAGWTLLGVVAYAAAARWEGRR